jgi:hypothetical protein
MVPSTIAQVAGAAISAIGPFSYFMSLLPTAALVAERFNAPVEPPCILSALFVVAFTLTVCEALRQPILSRRTFIVYAWVEFCIAAYKSYYTQPYRHPLMAVVILSTSLYHQILITVPLQVAITLKQLEGAATLDVVLYLGMGWGCKHLLKPVVFANAASFFGAQLQAAGDRAQARGKELATPPTAAPAREPVRSREAPEARQLPVEQPGRPSAAGCTALTPDRSHWSPNTLWLNNPQLPPAAIPDLRPNIVASPTHQPGAPVVHDAAPRPCATTELATAGATLEACHAAAATPLEPRAARRSKPRNRGNRLSRAKGWNAWFPWGRGARGKEQSKETPAAEGLFQRIVNQAWKQEGAGGNQPAANAAGGQPGQHGALPMAPWTEVAPDGQELIAGGSKDDPDDRWTSESDLALLAAAVLGGETHQSLWIGKEADLPEHPPPEVNHFFAHHSLGHWRLVQKKGDRYTIWDTLPKPMSLEVPAALRRKATLRTTQCQPDDWSCGYRVIFNAARMQRNSEPTPVPQRWACTEGPAVLRMLRATPEALRIAINSDGSWAMQRQPRTKFYEVAQVAEVAGAERAATGGKPEKGKTSGDATNRRTVDRCERKAATEGGNATVAAEAVLAAIAKIAAVEKKVVQPALPWSKGGKTLRSGRVAARVRAAGDTAPQRYHPIHGPDQWRPRVAPEGPYVLVGANGDVSAAVGRRAPPQSPPRAAAPPRAADGIDRQSVCPGKKPVAASPAKRPARKLLHTLLEVACAAGKAARAHAASGTPRAAPLPAKGAGARDTGERANPPTLLNDATEGIAEQPKPQATVGHEGANADRSDGEGRARLRSPKQASAEKTHAKAPMVTQSTASNDVLMRLSKAHQQPVVVSRTTLSASRPSLTAEEVALLVFATMGSRTAREHLWVGPANEVEKSASYPLVITKQEEGTWRLHRAHAEGVTHEEEDGALVAGSGYEAVFRALSRKVRRRVAAVPPEWEATYGPQLLKAVRESPLYASVNLETGQWKESKYKPGPEHAEWVGNMRDGRGEDATSGAEDISDDKLDNDGDGDLTPEQVDSECEVASDWETEENNTPLLVPEAEDDDSDAGLPTEPPDNSPSSPLGPDQPEPVRGEPSVVEEGVERAGGPQPQLRQRTKHVGANSLGARHCSCCKRPGTNVRGCGSTHVCLARQQHLRSKPMEHRRDGVEQHPAESPVEEMAARSLPAPPPPPAGEWYERAPPRIPHQLRQGRFIRGKQVFVAGLCTAIDHMRAGRVAAVGAALEAAHAEAVAEMSVSATKQGSRPAPAAQRARRLILAGQVRRGVTALTSQFVEAGEAVVAARKQLVDGIVSLPGAATPSEEPATQSDDEAREWVRAIQQAAKRTRGDAAPGPTGLPHSFIKRIVSEDPAATGMLAQLMPHLLQQLPEFLCRMRLATLAKTKRNGQRKLRTIACGEALLRLVERAVITRYSAQMLAASPHSAAHLRDGALTCGAVLQGRVARGESVVSLDAARAYDTVKHEAILAELAAAGVPGQVRRFVALLLQQRDYASGGVRLTPPSGRGIPQGTALGPILFALVAERAARAAAAVAPQTLVITYLDNLFLAGNGADLVGAIAAATDQWADDGLTRGECFTINCDIEGIAAGGEEARFLGIAPGGFAPERLASARHIAQLATALGGQAELIVLRDSVAAQAVYDQRAGALLQHLRDFDADIASRLADRLGLSENARQIVWLPPTRRGLGVRPLAATRDAAVLRAGLAGLTGKHNALTDAVWDLATAPAGAFFELFASLAERAGCAVDSAQRVVKMGERVLVRPPSTLEQAARQLMADNIEVSVAEERAPDDGTAHANTATARLLCGSGAKPELDDDTMKAAVWLHCGTSEPQVAGVKQGDECPLCRKRIAPGHHRWCDSMAAQPALQHHMVRDAVAEWVARVDNVHVRTEVPNVMPGGAMVRADVVIAAPETKGSVMIEVKTVDLRCASHRRGTLAIVDARLRAEIQAHYHGAALPLVVSHAGAFTRETAATIERLQALMQHGAPHLAEGPTLVTEIGKACAEAEARSFADWAEAVSGVTMARQTEEAGGAAQQREQQDDTSNIRAFAADVHAASGAARAGERWPRVGGVAPRWGGAGARGRGVWQQLGTGGGFSRAGRG